VRLSKHTLFWIVFAVFLALDQGVKFWVRKAIPVHGSIRGLPWPGVFEITLTYNEGIAFGMFQGMGVFLSPVALIIAAGAAWYSYRHPREPRATHVAMGLLASGAVGNLYDRIALGKVTDMFQIRLFEFPVFNVADAAICVATFMLVVIWFREALQPEVKAPAPPEADATPEAEDQYGPVEVNDR
jgi:signal peptidase II